MLNVDILVFLRLRVSKSKHVTWFVVLLIFVAYNDLFQTQRQHVINEEPLHGDLSSATAEMDVMVSNRETVRKHKVI